MQRSTQSSDDADRAFMREALGLARRGRTHPNPRVGALVVKRGRIVGRGYHVAAGRPHAEVVALRRAGDAARGAHLYVTLEPCNFAGRTPPCTEAVLASGVRRVVIATRDPHPRVKGRAIAALKRAGLVVETGVLGAESRAINAPYNTFQRLGRPYVELKVAQTLDGRVALRNGDSRWITGPEARRQGHRLRAAADAVLVGGETVRRDDPRLTVRSVAGRHPLRVVVTTDLRLPESRRLFTDRKAETVVFTGREAARSRRARRLAGAGVTIVPVRRRGSGLDLDQVLRVLARERGALRILVESGGRLASALLQRRLVDRLHAFIAPAVLGDEHRSWVSGLGIGTLSDMPRLVDVEIRRRGDDIWLAGDLPT